MTALQKLISHGSQLTALPSTIGQLKNLQFLDIAANQVSALPSEIGGLSSLNAFDLSANQVAALPAEIGNLQALADLNISSNPIAVLPAQIGGLKALQGLIADHCQIGAIPPEIGDLSRSRSSIYRSTSVTAVPTESGGCKRSIRWKFQSQTSALPADQNLRALKRLRRCVQCDHVVAERCQNRRSSLTARGNQLTPYNRNRPMLSSQPALEHNALTSIPPEIGQCSNLVAYRWATTLTYLPRSGCSAQTLTRPRVIASTGEARCRSRRSALAKSACCATADRQSNLARR